jgi:ribosome biogenesis protein Nip4
MYEPVRRLPNFPFYPHNRETNMKTVVNVRFVTINKNTRDWARDYEKKLYSYFTDLNLKEKDLVVVDTSNGWSLAEVVETNVETRGLCGKWIVQKVDTDAFEKRIEREKQIASIRSELKARLKAKDEMDLFADLAKHDTTSAELLEALKKLEA